MATRRLELVFTGDTRGLERAFGRAGSASRKMDGSIGRSIGTITKFGAAATAGFGVAFVAGVGKAVAAASDLNESLNKSAAVFEGSAGKMEQWANDAANSLGMTKAAALDGAASIGAMLKPMGATPQAAAMMSRTMTQLASDMGSFNNEDPTEMLDRIRAGLSGESEPLRRFGSNLSDARVKVHAVNEGIAKQGEELTDLQKVQARYSLLLQDTRDQQGDFARTSDGVANATRVFKANMGELTAEIGAAFLPAAGKGLAVVNGWVRSFRDHWPQIKPTVVAVLGAVRGALSDVAAWVERNWPTIRAVTVAVFAGVRSAIQGAIQWIKANVVPTIAAVVSGAQAFWDRFGGTVTAVFRLVLQVVRRSLAAVRGVVETALALIRGDWSAAWAGVKTVVTNVLGGLGDVIRGLIPIAVKALTALGKLAIDGLRAGLKGAASAVRSGIVTGFSRLGDLPGFLARKGIELGKAILRGIVDGIKSAPGAIRDAIGGLIPDSIGGIDVPGFLGGASGGFIPGVYRGRDDRLMRVASGEAILTPQQQSMIPGGRATLSQIFAQTGGRIGGNSFRTGGFAAGDAYRRAVGKLGTRYVYGKWDCSKFATYVAGVAVGGSTQSAWLASSPATGGEALIWGFRRNGGGTTYDGGTDEHMGVGIIGPDGKRRWFDNSRPVVKSDARSAQWQQLRVPKGWENVGSDDTGGNTADEGVSVFEATRRALARAGVGKRAGAIARRVLGATGERTTGVSEGLAGGSLRPGEDRAVSRAGRAARTAARKIAGITPDEVASRGEEAERKATVRFYQLHIREIDKARRVLRKRKAQILRDIASLPGKKAEKQKKAKATRLNVARATIDAELKELMELRAEANEALAQLREQRVADDFQEDYDARGETPEPPTEADYLDAAVAQAELTPGTDDDLAAAQAVEAYAGRQYQAALASGDPRQIAEAARALAAAQQNRAQIEALRANTEALAANTEAVSRSFGGSVTFGYRGQDYVLRSLAPPSSDRLDASLLGV